MPDIPQESRTKKMLNIVHVLRRDSLSKWNTSTLPLYYGEVALGYSSDGILTEIRAGEDGQKTWRQLGTIVPTVTSNANARKGMTLGFDENTGNAILFHIYEWAKQTSLLGGRYTAGSGWNFNNATPAQKDSQNEVAAFIKQETTDLKLKVDQVTEENYEEIYGEPYTGTPEQQAKLGKYQISVSTDGEVTWIPSGEPFTITLEDYTGGDTKYISVDIDDDSVIIADAKVHDIASARGDVWNFISYSYPDQIENGSGQVEILNQFDTSNGTIPFKIIDYLGPSLVLDSDYNIKDNTGTIQSGQVYQVYNGVNSDIVVYSYIRFTSLSRTESTGLADAADVRRYVESTILNTKAGDGIVITTQNNERYFAVKLNENAGTIYSGIVNSGSGLDLSSDGLKLDDNLNWIWNCGNATIE